MSHSHSYLHVATTYAVVNLVYIVGGRAKKITWALLYGGLNADASAPSLEHAGEVASHGGYYTRISMISLVVACAKSPTDLPTQFSFFDLSDQARHD